jgi:hypothetical protein
MVQVEPMSLPDIQKHIQEDSEDSEEENPVSQEQNRQGRSWSYYNKRRRRLMEKVKKQPQYQLLPHGYLLLILERYLDDKKVVGY